MNLPNASLLWGWKFPHIGIPINTKDGGLERDTSL